MNAHPHPGTNDPDIEPDIGLGAGQRLPTAEAVLAATLALMTGHAQACCDEHRWVMLTKIVANLHLLAHHPGVSPGFKTVAEQLYAMWARLREEWQEQEHEPAQPSSQPSAQRSAAQPRLLRRQPPSPHCRPINLPLHPLVNPACCGTHLRRLFNERRTSKPDPASAPPP